MNDLAIKEIILEKVKYQMNEIFEGELLDKMRLDLIKADFLNLKAKDMVLMLKTHVMAEETNRQVITYPADWWEAFKERWFPLWLTRKRGIKYKRIEVKAYATYPKLKLVFPDEQGKHVLKFIITENFKFNYGNGGYIE